MGKKSTPLSIRDQIYESLKAEILDNRYGPGDELPIDKLAIEYGVSTTPVREALIRLGNEGLVSKSSNRGARVAPVRVEDIRHIFELRMLLEPYAAEQTVLLFPGVDLNEIEARLHRMRAGNWQAADYRDMDRTIHELLYIRLPNPILKEIMNSLYQQSFRIRYYAQEGRELRNEIVQAAVAEHLAIIVAMKKADGALVAEAVRQHIAKSEERTLLAISDRVPGP